MSDRKAHRNAPPEDSCACSMGEFVEIIDVEGGMLFDSPVFREHERVGRERFAESQAEGEKAKESDGDP